MSKSENNMSTLYFADDDETIRKKVMKAKTDSGPTAPNTPKPDYIDNIFMLMQLVCEPDVISKFEADYNNCNIRYGDLKKQLAEDMVKFMAPIRQKTNDILANDQYLVDVMKKGAEQASKSAVKTMKLVRDAMGLNYL
jgi:tryptophanyl-tRNA synthetase